MKKLCRVLVTPRDVVDVNQLRSLTVDFQSDADTQLSTNFRVGQQCLFWLNMTDYIRFTSKVQPDFPAFAEVVSVNELARQLALWA